MNTYKLPAYSAAREFYAPNTVREDEFSKPDIRTTLFWNPKLAFDENGEALVNFFNSDNTTRFHIRIEGISTNGDPFVKIWTAEMEQ
jgi:hypothetical protein